MFGAHGAERAIIRSQESTGQNSEMIIESQEMRAYEATKNFQLISALQGEGAFKKITEETEPDKQIEIASKIISTTPFILKFIPDHLTEVPEQAGFIVAVAKALEESSETLH